MDRSTLHLLSCLIFLGASSPRPAQAAGPVEQTGRGPRAVLPDADPRHTATAYDTLTISVDLRQVTGVSDAFRDLMTRAVERAYLNTRRGKSYLEKALAARPDFTDARLGMGLVRYYTGVLSGPMKIVLYILGMGGNREEGLLEVRQVAASGGLSQPEALFFLADIYDEYEGRPDDAAAILRGLMRRFPGNVMYEYLYALNLCENGRFAEADTFVGRFLARQDLQYPFYRWRMGLYYARALQQLGAYSRSTATYLAYLDTLRTTTPDTMRRVARTFGDWDWPDLVAECYYGVGMNAEYGGDREEAVTWFRRAVATGSRNRKAEIAGLLKARASLAAGRAAEADGDLKRIRALGLKDLPLPYVRRFYKLRHDVLGEVRYR